MKAMILAAGLGTRLRPLTNDRPKALVEVGGRTLLEITLSRLREFGIQEVIINVHHFAEMVIDYLKAKNNFGMRIELSHEEVLLDTGGGLKKTAWFFLEKSTESDEPFFLHNVDVISTIDLKRMAQFHREHNALATLAVQQRETSRYLLFDDKGQLCGRRAARDSVPLRDSTGEAAVLTRPDSNARVLAFSGIHVISPRIFEKMTEDGAFSIISTYLQLAEQGKNVLAFPANEYYWRDLGRPENISQVELDYKNGVLA
jgi:NDP-sugar pyrophosphorylase family protein